MPTTAERIETGEALVARLEGELETARAAEGKARATREELALPAIEGDIVARKRLDKLTRTAASAAVEAENVAFALSGARKRLVQLQAEAEAERLAGVKARALEIARERRELGGQLEDALGRLNTLFVSWQRLGQELARLRDGNRGLYLPHGTGDARPFIAALPPELRAALSNVASWVHPADRRRIGEGDPAAHILRAAGELEPLPAAPLPLTEQVIADLNAELDAEAARPPRDLHQVLDENPTAGLRLVEVLPGGGGVWERIPPDELNAPEAAA